MSGWIKDIFNKQISILDKMELRDNDVRAHNEEIIKSIPHVIDAITDIISTTSAKNLKWTDIIYADDEEVLILIGTVESKVGDSLPLDSGEVVDITPFNVDSFNRVLKIGIPMNLVENGTREDVIEFLEFAAQEQLEQSIDENAEMLSTEDFDHDVFTDIDDMNEIMDALAVEFHNDPDQFDFNELDDDQFEQLRIFEKYNGKGNKH